MADFFPVSDEIKGRIEKINDKKGRIPKYDWNGVPVGMSFVVNKADNPITLGGLQSLAYKAGKRKNKKFYVYEHATCFEVARLADPDPKFLTVEEMVKKD